jgi:hypothetical protein
MKIDKDTFQRISKLDIPVQAKAELIKLWHRARQIAEGILNFLARHRQFSESILLGALVAWLLSQVPWIGTFLALAALVVASAIGVMKELKEDMNQLFKFE